jgi:hypothetical protein
MARAQCGQAERVVAARVFLIPDAHQRDLQQVDDGGQHLFARQAGPLEGGVDLAPDRRQRLAEFEHAFVFDLVAQRAPARVIAVLLAVFRVAPGGLQVAVVARADPHLGPGRRNGERGDARQRGRVAHRLAVRVDVAEAGAAGQARDARHAVVHIT